ncbi:MAG TPA: GDSL-type esterase/lipase family protein [Dongiaceae bacterium]|nr:GDSL-type esterase/lipase family protein [Dongiaceae bacterium]
MKTTKIALSAFCGLMLFGCIPDDATINNGWMLGFGSETGIDATGADGPGILVFGDSLVQNLDQNALAQRVRAASGLKTVTFGAGGASLAHYSKPRLLDNVNLPSVAEGTAFYRQRITVLALGSNDVRILEAEQNIGGGYRIADFNWAMDSTIDSALATSSCVFITNVAGNVQPVYVDDVQAVNQAIAAKIASRTNVYLIDWNGHSAGHLEWFNGVGDVHHSVAGQAAYMDFIANNIAWQMVFSGC